MAGIEVRRAELDDQEGIATLVNATPGRRGRLEDRFGEFVVSELIYSSYLSITATDDQGSVIGFAAFSATPTVVPNVEDVQAWLEWISSGKESALSTTRYGANVSNTLWLRFCVALEDIEMDVMANVLRTAFSTLPEVDMAAYTLPMSIGTFPDVEGSFEQVQLPDAPEDAIGEDVDFDDMPTEYACKLLVSMRDRHIPPILVRDALVEDYDDLVAVFETHSKSLKEQYGEFFLAELIESQDDRNKAIVGQVNKQAVGLMSLTCEVDLTALQQCFELEPYNNLETGISEEELKAYNDALAAKAAEEERLAALAKKNIALAGLGPRAMVLGLPGSGKTQLCKALAEQKEMVQVNFETIQKGLKEGGNELEAVVERLFQEDCQTKGWILEGFPRNPVELEGLMNAGFVPKKCLSLVVNEEVAMERFMDRRIDPETGDEYNMSSNPPAEEEVEARLQKVNEDDTEDGFKAKVAIVQPAIAAITESLEGICPLEEIIAADSTEDIAKASITFIDRQETRPPSASPSGTGSQEGGEEATEKEEEVVDNRSIEERLGIVDILKIDPDEVKPAAFAVTLFCLDDLYESRARDFLRKAFMMFPDREYCVVTLPHTAAESALLANFTMVAPRPTSTFSHVLYLLHRDGLLAPEVRVTRALESHLGQLEPMLAALPNGHEVAEAVVAALDKNNTPLTKNPQMSAFVATCREQVLGVIVLTRKGCDKSGVRWMKSAYRLDDYVVYNQHDHTEQAHITHYVINPIFSRCTRFVLRETMRLYNKTCLYYRVYPGQVIAPLLPEMVQAPPRNRPMLRPDEVRGQAAPGDENEMTRKKGPHAEDVAEAKGEDSFALHFLTHKLLSEPKIVSHARIVVVGASDCGLSALESLVLMPYMQFTRLTLIAPTGIPSLDGSQNPQNFMANSAGGPAGYNKREIQQLSFGSLARVVQDRMVDIDREGSALQLEDGSIVPYDFLLICTGLQESTKSKLMQNSTSGTDARLHFIDSIESAARLGSSIESLIANASVKKVAVYGNSLSAYSAIQGLLASNVPATSIKFFNPTVQNDEDISPFADVFVRDKVMGTIEELGVEINRGCVLEDVLADADGNLSGGVFSEGGEKRDSDFEVLVCCAKADVDPDVFAAINESGLVYDGRLVIDGRFRTADPQIYAAGTLTKHSRRFGRKRPCHDCYNSREVGQALAKALVEEVDPLAFPVPVNENTGEAIPPRFSNPRGVSACLPGGLYYTHLQCPPTYGSTSDEPSFEFGRECVTNPKDALAKVGGGRGVGLRYCRIVLDVHRRVASITYLGAQPVEDRNFAGLVGLQESYLNSLEHFYDKGTIPDLAKFLRDDWAVAVYHDRFCALCLSLSDKLESSEEVQKLLGEVKEAIASGNTKLSESNLLRKSLIGTGGEKISYKTRKSIESELLRFLRDNRQLLPFFCLPDGNTE